MNLLVKVGIASVVAVAVAGVKIYRSRKAVGEATTDNVDGERKVVVEETKVGDKTTITSTRLVEAEQN